MKERPALMNGAMVRATLREIDPKTQTRRIVKPQPPAICETVYAPYKNEQNNFVGLNADAQQIWFGSCPYGQPGDRLWVRETFVIESNRGIEPESIYKPPFDDGRPIRRVENLPDECYWQQCHYRATDEEPELCYEDGSGEPECKWKPSIHMPRWASRILLEIVSVRVERLQDISEADAIAEGVTLYPCLPRHAHMMARHAFRKLWESINGPGSWDANPWVWCISFKRVKP